jgi:hypothetical protein
MPPKWHLPYIYNTAEIEGLATFHSLISLVLPEENKRNSHGALECELTSALREFAERGDGLSS